MPSGTLPESSASGPRPASFGRLARRISSCTTNGIVSVVIIVAGLVFGRQVVEWWRPTAPVATAPPKSEFLDPSQPHVVRFGAAAWELRRQVVGGGLDDARKALRALVREATRPAAVPEQAPTAEERRFLATLAERPPVEDVADGWRLYQIDEPLLMVVGVKPAQIAGQAGAAAPPAGGALLRDGAAPQVGRPAAKPSVAESPVRVVVWGVAMPAGEGRFSLHVYAPSRGAANGLAAIPLPPDAERLLSFQLPDGSAWTAFAGDGGGDWPRWFDGALTKQHWKTVRGWNTFAGRTTAAFAAADGRRLEIFLSTPPGGRTQGLALSTAAATHPASDRP